MSYDIFISYRRDGGDTLAQLIYDRLTARGYRVFLDIESLRSGKFNEKLLSVIDECKDLVVILPPNSLERCSNPGDWLYAELSHALKRKKNIVPVMMKGFCWPDTLPEGLEELPNFNGIQDNKDYFDAVIDKITTLLTCKPIFMGSSLQKFKIWRRNLKLKEKLRKYRGLLITGLIAVVVAAGIYGYQIYKKNKIALADATTVSIIVYAPDNMSASEYYDAVDVLKKRFDILAEGEEYTLDVKDDIIRVQMPAKVFHDEDVATILRTRITRPIKLSIGTVKSSETISVTMDDIEKLEMVSGTNELFQFDDSELASAESYEYFTIDFDDSVQAEIDKIFGSDNPDLLLKQDYEEFMHNYTGYYLTWDAANSCYHLVDEIQDANMNALIKYNYSHESFSTSFTFNIMDPVEWENVKEIDAPGANQCDKDKVPGDTVTVQYTSTQKTMSDGEWTDTVAILKKRLDALQTPYAFGYTTTGPYNITIRIGTEKINSTIMQMMFGRKHNFDLQHPFYECPDPAYQTVERIQKDDGTYGLKVTYVDYNVDSYQEALASIQANTNQKLYLTYSDYMLANCDVTSQESTTSVVVDNLFAFGLEQIDEEHVYLLDFISAFFNEADLPCSYSMKSSRFSSNELEYDFTLDNSYITDCKKSVEQLVRGIYSDATFSSSEKYINIYLDLEANERFPQEVISLVKKLMEFPFFTNGEFGVRIYFTSDTASCFVMNSDYYKLHGMTYHVSFDPDKFKNYQDAFIDAINSDPFFQTTLLTEDSESWIWTR